MSRIALMAAALVLGLAAVPTKITLIGDVSVPGCSLGGSAAMAQRASDPRYQPGHSACRDGAGRRC
jgi:hypothetical protein